jgi:DNA repair protein RadC
MIASVSEVTAPAVPAPPRAGRQRRAVAVPSAFELAARSEAELIAQVLGGPEPADEVIRCSAALARLPFWQRRAIGAQGLISDHGVSPSRAVRLVALWELAERWFPDDRPSIETPRDVCLLLDGMRREPAERVVVVLLDARHRLLRVETIAHGTLNASRFIPRDLLGPALSAGAAAVVLVHNHPSGDPAPSRSDRRVTEVMRAACELVGLALLDHVILGGGGHYSFRHADGWGEAARAAS